MNNKEFLLNVARHINKCYKDYFIEQLIRGLPITVVGTESLSKGIEKELISKIKEVTKERYKG